MELEALAPLETVKNTEPEERDARIGTGSLFLRVLTPPPASQRQTRRRRVPKRRSCGGLRVAATGLRFGSNQICSLFTTQQCRLN